MEKRIGIAMALCAALALTACGAANNEADEDTIFVSKNGDISGYIQSVFAESYYSEDELGFFINHKVADYVEKAGEDTVKVESFTVEDGVASAMLDYASVTDYADFNGVEFFSGSVIAAQAAGYRFEGDFLPVEDGTLGTAQAKGSAFMDEEDYKCVIIGQPTSVSVSGDIVYVSADNVELVSSRIARVAYDKLDVHAKAGYIIYKK